MPYAIMRFEKRKGEPASVIEKHHERKKEWYASNPDVDADRSRLNYHLSSHPATAQVLRGYPVPRRVRPAGEPQVQGAEGQREVHRLYPAGAAGTAERALRTVAESGAKYVLIKRIFP